MNSRAFELPGPESFVELAHYETQAGQTFPDQAAAYDHYCRSGEAQGLTPSPFFYPEWYRWQNPNWVKFPSALAHFVRVAQNQPIDPAPFIDSVLFLRRNPGYANMVEALLALIEGRDISVAPDLDTHLEALAENQRRIHDAIRSSLFGTPSGKRRRLVWVQSGKAFRPAQWFRPEAPRSWDMMCNWYALSGVDIRFGEMHLRQSGTKATGIHHVLTHYPNLLAQYDQVLFLDDDLGLKHEEIDKVFDIAVANGLDIFQPSVAPGSQCVWPDLFQRKNRDFHETTAVEIMMFGFSKRALKLCAPAFGRSISGFGLDFICSEQVREVGWKCGVIDAVAAEHIEIIDEKGGAYYEFMRSLGINQKFELYQTIQELGKVPDFAMVDSIRGTSTERAFGPAQTTSKLTDGPEKVNGTGKQTR